MRVIIIPNMQCVKCFTPLIGTINDDSRSITFEHFNDISDISCIDKNQKFVRLLEEFTKEI